MVTINRKVLDISHYNIVSSWSQVRNAGILGIIHKATEGTTYVDDQYTSYRSKALDAGLLWGAYHFANGDNVQDQVENFLRTVGVDENTLYALDWEDDPNGNTMNVGEAQDFLERIAREIGQNRCVVYSGNLAKEMLGDSVNAFFGGHRLWLAQYGDSPVVQPSWDDYWLWQYSDGTYGPGPHGCPGVDGDVDTNSYDGRDEDLRAEWSGVQARTLRPPRPAA